MNYLLNLRRKEPRDIVQKEPRFEAHGSSNVFQGNVLPNSTFNIFLRRHEGGSASIAGKTFNTIEKRVVGSYVRRAALRNVLKAHLHDRQHKKAERSQVVVVYGLGGAGKTQLVLSYIEEFRKDYKGTFWVDSSSKQSADGDYERLYNLLFDRNTAGAQQKAKDIVLAVNHLLGQQPGKWLLVFDNADNIENPNDDSYVDIDTYIPQFPSVDVIVTTRSSTAALMKTVTSIEVREMEEAEALDAFVRSSGLGSSAWSADNQREAASIVKELGMLALAINLAGHYIGQTPRLKANLSLYLPEYRNNRERLLKLQPNIRIHQYGMSILVSWELSFKSLVLKSEMASNLLLFLAFLDSDDIFLDMFRMPLEIIFGSKESLQPDPDIAMGKGKERANNTSSSSSSYQAPTDTSTPLTSLHDRFVPVGRWWGCISPSKPLEIYDIEDSFAIISSFSLIRLQEYASGYSMHKLVHAWGHDRLNPHDKVKFALSSLEFLAKLVYSCDPDPIFKRRLIRHIMANFLVVQATFSVSLKAGKNLKVLKLLTLLATFLHDTGHLTQALQLERYILEISTAIRDSQGGATANDLFRVHTLRAKSNVAATLGEMKRLEEAESMKEEVLHECRSILGNGHAETIIATSNKAFNLHYQGQSHAAFLMQTEAVEKMKEIRGEDHPTTLDVIGNLASMLDDLGRHREALLIWKDNLEKRVKILGNEHKTTISAMNNLARSLCDLGDYDEAAAMQEDVLKIRSKTLGDEHPLTILSMSNLAITLNKMGDSHGAASMQRDVLQKTRERLGDDHVDTVLAMNNLACMLNHCGKLQEGAKLYTEALEKRRRIQGEEHPSTIASMNNLAAILEDLGEHQEAASMKQEVLEKMRRIRGHDHPHTLTAMSNWAYSLRNFGKLEEATLIGREVLEKRRKILGDENPDTITAMDYLTVTLYKSGKLQEALTISEDALDKAIRTRGMSHPITTNIRDNLAVYKAAINQTGVKKGFRQKLHFPFKTKKLHQSR